MSLLSSVFNRLYKSWPARPSKHNIISGRWHKCRIEQMESRQLLSVSVAPIQIGSVYYEPHSGTDTSSNLIYITWDGGASDTYLKQVVIDTDKNQDGAISEDECFFHTAEGGPGVYGWASPTIVEKTGIVDNPVIDVQNGGTLMTITFTSGDFKAGGRLVIGVDVDEMGKDGKVSPTAEGDEFQDSFFTPTFLSSHYSSDPTTGAYKDYFDDELAGYSLNLPPDNYIPPSEVDETIFTAGLGMPVRQTPLPIIISGKVYEDLDRDNHYDPGDGDAGIPDVLVTLVNLDGEYASVTVQTDPSGNYNFTEVLPGKYQIVESQPGGYLSVGETPGTVGGEIHGAVLKENVLSGIDLEGGDDSIHNDFSETRPALLSGHVYFDANDNGIFDSGETGISDAVVELLDAQGNPTGITEMTDFYGYYAFDNLMPGTYGLQEYQPLGYLDGKDAAGTPSGGNVSYPDTDMISLISLDPGVKAINYDFGELLPASISGKVYADLNNNSLFDSGEPLLAGVTIYLLNDSKTQIASTQTDQNGEYCFTDLNPGVYGVEEVQPAGYYEGGDFIGSAGGNLDGVNRIIDAPLGPGVNAVHYDFYEVLPAKISGYVFQDGAAIQVKKGDPLPNIPSLRNGVLTPDDTRLAGVEVQLCDGSGYPMQDAYGNPITTTTNADGYYEFTGLVPGDYSVIVKTPDGYIPGVDTAGSEGGLVVNRYVVLDPSLLSTLAVDPQGKAIVKIALDSGDAAVQYNFSVVKITEPPDRPPAFPSPPPPLPDSPPRMPIMPDPLIYGVNYVLPPIIFPQQLMGGSGGPPGYTWHLSVINGGQPRRLQNGEFAANSQSQLFDPDTWTGADVNQGGVWIIADTNGVPVQKYRFGLRGAIPVTGDWNGNGVTKIGVFIDGLWFLDLNGNGIWDENDLWAKLGQHGDRPVSGDWDGDGKSDIGIFGPTWFGDPRALAAEAGLPDARNPFKNHFKNMPPEPEDATIGWRSMKRTSAGNMRSDLIDHVFRFGTEEDKPVAGDWNGDGVYSIGIFRNGTWFLDMDGDGRWGPEDRVLEFGQEGDIPVVGDWTGDGISKLGVYRGGTFYLDTNNNHVLDATDKVFTLGNPGDKPFAGDFTGSGVDTVGVYQDGGGAETVAAPTPATAPAGD